MVPLADILARQKDVSGQLSSQTRALALGFLAFVWALLTAHDDPLKAMAAYVGRGLPLALAGLSVLVLVCDWLQYHFATESAKATAWVAEHSNPQEAEYDDKSRDWRWQWRFYYAKLVLLALAFLILVVIFVLLIKAPVKSDTAPVQPVAVACTPACCQPPPPPPAPPAKTCEAQKHGRRKRRPCPSVPSGTGAQPKS